MSRRMFLPLILLALLSLSLASVAAQAEDCPATQFGDLQQYGVVTPGDANRVRTAPSRDADLVGMLEPGEWMLLRLLLA